MFDPGPCPYDLDAYGDPVWVVIGACILISGAPWIALAVLLL